MVVAAYGIVESELKRLIKRHVSEKSTGGIGAIVNDVISKRYAWKFCEIKKTLGEIDVNWRCAVIRKLTPKQKDSITSLNNERNSIAHGDSSSITFKQAKTYFKSSIEGLHIIASVIAPNEEPALAPHQDNSSPDAEAQTTPQPPTAAQ